MSIFGGESRKVPIINKIKTVFPGMQEWVHVGPE